MGATSGLTELLTSGIRFIALNLSTNDSGPIGYRDFLEIFPKELLSCRRISSLGPKRIKGTESQLQTLNPTHSNL